MEPNKVKRLAFGSKTVGSSWFWRLLPSGAKSSEASKPSRKAHVLGGIRRSGVQVAKEGLSEGVLYAGGRKR